MLEKHKQSIQGCKKCILHDGRHNIVYGKGNPNANILIIGEAPGKNEDEMGVPFVGKAGKNLDNLLDLAKIDKNDAYITNVVKCRPPSNRNPKAEEINMCSKYLRKQTSIIKPKFIICLGNFATKFILKNEEGITNVHGKLYDLGKFYVYPVFHPASTIYDPKKKIVLEQDFIKLGKIIKDNKENKWV